MKRKVAVFWVSLAMMSSLVIMIVEIPIPVSAPTIYVDDDYAVEDPTHKKTIQSAVDNASAGDTVFVYNGTYFENVVVNKTINLTGISKDNTTIDGGGGLNVVRITANWVNVSGFTIINGSNGILLSSSNNSCIDNNISYCDDGIWAEASSNNKIITNTFYFNGYSGIYLEYSNYTIITGNIFINNSYEGILLDKSENTSIENNYFANSLEGIVSFGSDHNDIINNTFLNNEYGIDIQNCNYINIINNNVISQYYGLWGFNIIGLNIINNYVSAQWRAMDISNLIYSNITNNTVANCTDEGINLWSSSDYNIIANNSFFNNSYAFWHDGSSNNIIIDNIFWNNSYAIFIWECSQFTITNNHAFNNEYGIYFWEDVYNSNITNNNVSGNDYGIFLDQSNNDYNLISENLVANNEFGIVITLSNNNTIYHNNVINNTNQASDDSVNNWGNGYPLGGNYWSDYIGVDLFKGPNQNQPGDDGIGDTNYTIDIDSVDNYPLMEPYTFEPLENFTFLRQGWNFISIPLIQENQNLTKVLEMIDGYYDVVQWYDTLDVNDPWKNYVVGKPFGNDLLHLNETMGFWIHITQPGDMIFLYNGTQPTQNQTITLYPGWNMVGYPSLTSYNRTEGLNNLTFDQEVDAIWTYNASTQEWEELSASDYFELERGDWIHATAEVTWEVPL